MPCIEWKYTPNFNDRSANHLQIKKVENQLNFFINRVFVDSFQAEPFFGKYFGFQVDNRQKIAFRSFKFCKLVEDDTYGKGINISSKNISSIKNLSTLYLSLSTSDGIFKLDNFIKGVALAQKFFTADNLEDYLTLIAGERYIYNSETILHFYINDVINSLRNYLDKKDGISTSQLINAFSTFPVEAKQFLNNRFVSKQIQNIDKEIEHSEVDRKKSAVAAAGTGKKLVSNTKTDIAYLKDVLGESDFRYQIIADKLSNAIVQCGIDAFNVCKDHKGEIDYAKAIKSEEAYINEYEYALSIAVTERVKERAKDNLDSCKQYIKNKYFYSCWFCGKRAPEEPSKFVITIYKVNGRSLFPNSVQYSYVPFYIPRCNDCKKVHSQSSDAFTLALIVCSIAGLIVGALSDGYWFAGLIVGALIGWMIGINLRNQLAQKKESKTQVIPALAIIPY